MKEVFLSLIYLIVLYLFLLVTLLAAMYWIKKKQKLLGPFLLIVVAIVIDLFLFNRFILDEVILKRKNIRFEEYPTPYSFSESRVPNLISGDDFHNFRSALYKKAAAVGSYTINKKILKNYKVPKIYMILQDYSSKYPLYDELNKLNIKQFVQYGMSNIDSWTVEERLFFSMILNAILEGFFSHQDFHEDYLHTEKIIGDLLDDVDESYQFFTSKVPNWKQKKHIEKGMLVLFDLTNGPLFSYDEEDYCLYVEPDIDDDSNNFSGVTPDFYDFIFHDISAKEYIVFLFERDRFSEHTFVSLKDYYELINSNKNYKKFRGYHNLLNNDLLRVLGVLDPIIKYYPSARFLDKGDILSIYAHNNMFDSEDILYLEGSNEKTNKPYLSKPQSSFSYQVLDYNPNILSLQYQASEDGYLYYSDCYDTYWNAYIDGKKTDIYKANVAFKAIKIPGGRHKVDFIYNPVFFKVSLWLYYITCGICSVYLVAGTFKKIRKKRY